MKKFKIVSIVMLVVAVALLALGIIISTVSSKPQEEIYIALVQLNSVLIACAGIGVLMMTAKSDTAKKVGNGLTIVGFVTALVCALATMHAISKTNNALGENSEELLGTSIGAVITIVAAALLLLHYAFLLVAYILNKSNASDNPNDDVRIVRIKEWKQLKEEGIITEAEYEEKRVQILGLKKK